MRHILLTSVAATALMAALATAGAQQAPRDRGDQPAAEQNQQAPRGRNAEPSREQRGSGSVQEWPGTRAGQALDRQGRDQQRSTTGQSNQRSDEPRKDESRKDEPRKEMQRGETRDDSRGRSDRAQSPRDRASESRDAAPSRERSTTGQSSGERSADPPRRGDTTRTDTQRRELQRQDTRRDDTTRSETQRIDATRDGRSGRSSISLSNEQRSRIGVRFSERIDRMNVRPLSRSQISVSIGATVPRSVRLHAVPRDIVAIYPEFRGHQFVVVEDEIVIVEPRSQRVVTVLPMGGEARAQSRTTVRETTGSAGAATRSRIRLSEDDRQVIRTMVMREPSCRLEQRLDFFLFVPIPRTVQVCELPSQLVSEVPAVRPYRYVVRGDDVVLVDPEDENRVVEVID